MTDDDLKRVQRVRAIVEEILGSEEPASNSLLLESCDRDADLTKEVRALLVRVLAEQDGPPVPDLAHGFLRGLICPAEQVREVSALLTELVADSGASASRRYVLGDTIGRGGMGVVRLAEDKLLHRKVAIKTLLVQENAVELDVDGRVLGRFLDEAQITAQLDHPGVVPVHDMGIDAAGRIFYSMPVVHGIGLDEAICRSRAGELEWSQTRVLGVVLKACQAIAFAHSKGVLHRDLKPANIMVGEYGQVYVMDWGLASPGSGNKTRVESDFRRLDDPGSSLYTRGGSVMGTVGFMSPEQARGEHDELDERSDVYAMGAVLHELLAGTPPAPGAAGIRASPVELAAICERAIAWDREDRYPTMQDLAEDLQAFLENRVVGAYEAGSLAELKKWVMRNKGPAVACGVIVMAMAVGLFVSVRLARQRLLAADLVQLPALVAEAEELWPALPAQTAQLEEWLTRAEDLVSREGEHRKRRIGSDEFESPRRRDFLAGLTSFAGADGLLEQVRGRLYWAKAIEELSVTGPTATGRWTRAAKSISDEQLNPHYRGLKVSPQLGLLPIGQDPNSLLWEFSALLTGDEPERGRDGRLHLTKNSAIVLVLLPGGSFGMGAQSEDPLGANCDPAAVEDEGPVRTVTLSPYFFSKFEVTQSQWLRLTGNNPSCLHPGSRLWQEPGESGSLLHPVNDVSWFDAVRGLARADLLLPTEAQWEFAARAATASPWFSGWDPSSLTRFANIAGSEGRDDHVYKIRLVYEEHHDQNVLIAQVGAYEPNAFGLHDMLGNVWELCLDSYRTCYEGVGTMDPLALTGCGDDKVVRGGGYESPAAYARVSERQGTPAALLWKGVRPSRHLVQEER